MIPSLVALSFLLALIIVPYDTVNLLAAVSFQLITDLHAVVRDRTQTSVKPHPVLPTLVAIFKALSAALYMTLRIYIILSLLVVQEAFTLSKLNLAPRSKILLKKPQQAVAPRETSEKIAVDEATEAAETSRLQVHGAAAPVILTRARKHSIENPPSLPASLPASQPSSHSTRSLRNYNRHSLSLSVPTDDLSLISDDDEDFVISTRAVRAVRPSSPPLRVVRSSSSSSSLASSRSHPSAVISTTTSPRSFAIKSTKFADLDVSPIPSPSTSSLSAADINQHESRHDSPHTPDGDRPEFLSRSSFRSKNSLEHKGPLIPTPPPSPSSPPSPTETRSTDHSSDSKTDFVRPRGSLSSLAHKLAHPFEHTSETDSEGSDEGHKRRSRLSFGKACREGRKGTRTISRLVRKLKKEE